MAEKADIFYDSKDGKSQIHAVEWIPEEREPKAILQIVHGMQEYADRYDAFARYVADRGFIVVADDHLGHGSTVTSDADFGYFAKENGDTIIIEDLHTLHKMKHSEHPGLPYFMYGFSMGSFMARKYLSMYGEGLDGAIIGGTGWIPSFRVNLGIGIANLLTLIHGDHYKSRFLASSSFRGYFKRIPHPKTAADWICSKEEVVSAYMNDPLCGRPFTVNGFKTIFQLVKYIEDPDNAKRVPPNLPLLFISGKEDPVGQYTEGVKKSAQLYLDHGVKNVSLLLYDNMRHEIHNEERKHIVYLDILEWLESLM